LDVVNFFDGLCEYLRLKARFHEVVDFTTFHMHFVCGHNIQARRAVAGFEEVPGGLSKAIKMLEHRFRQPHVVALNGMC